MNSETCVDMSISGTKRRGNTSCCVVGCHNKFRNTTPGTHFYTFPVSKYKLERRKRWVIAVNRKNPDGSLWEPNTYSRICCYHFVGNAKSEDPLSPSYNPTIFPKVYGKKTLPANSAVKRYERSKKRAERKIHYNNSAINDASETMERSLEAEIIISPEKVDVETQVYFQTETFCLGETKVFICNRLVENNICSAETQTYVPEEHRCVGVLIKKRTADKSCGENIVYVERAVGPDLRDLDSNSSLICKSGFHGASDIKTDQEMLDLAGVTLCNFQLLLKILSTAKRLKVSKENRLLIFLIKMKCGLTYSALRVLFGIHRTTVSRIFISTLQYLAAATKDFVTWPSKEIVQATMPTEFTYSYKDCRVIIDCTEISVQQPSTVEQRVQLYSHYKKGFTVKILVGCTPGGLVSFISRCYGGRTSDSQITNRSGFLDLLEPGDLILADKGFPGIKSTVDENGKGVLVVMPPFLHNHQFSAEEVAETHKIASVRIHIERIMQRLKIYRILTKFCLNMLPFADDVVFMCGVLGNLQPPIIRESDSEHFENT